MSKATEGRDEALYPVRSLGDASVSKLAGARVRAGTGRCGWSEASLGADDDDVRGSIDVRDQVTGTARKVWRAELGSLFGLYHSNISAYLRVGQPLIFCPTMAPKRNLTGFDPRQFARAAGQPANDPWARAEAWRYTGPFTRFNRFKGAFPGFGIATVAFACYLVYEQLFMPKPEHHGEAHGEGHH